MVGLAVELAQLSAETLAHLPHDLLAACEHVIRERATPIPRDEDQVGVKVVDNTTSPTYIRVRFPSW
jgi:hypothetical protein